MTKKQYNINLDEEIVKKSLELIQPYGGKLSPLINEFLKEFIKNK